MNVTFRFDAYKHRAPTSSSIHTFSNVHVIQSDKTVKHKTENSIASIENKLVYATAIRERSPNGSRTVISAITIARDLPSLAVGCYVLAMSGITCDPRVTIKNLVMRIMISLWKRAKLY